MVNSCMTFYHGTSKENYKLIIEEGVLHGRRYITSDGEIIKEISRCTYLTIDIDEAKCYGDVILEVSYNPFINPSENNYIDGCWQLRVYEPICINNIKIYQ